MVYPGDVFALDLAAYWSWSTYEQEQVGGSWLRQLAGQRRKAKVLADVLGRLPLQAVDERLLGAKAPWTLSRPGTVGSDGNRRKPPGRLPRRRWRRHNRH